MRFSKNISPCLADLFDVLADVLRLRMTTSIDTCLMTVPTMALRLPVVVSLTAHGLMIALVLLAVWGHATTMPLHVVAPLPPSTPDPPPLVTDARVFPNALTLYSSLPLKMPAQGGALPVYVADGVGINFLSLPDIGATYRQGNAEWRVWPGQALETFIVRRWLPEYPHGTDARGAVSVFLEYLITRDGSVKVLRTSGPPAFTGAAQSAIERWIYQPLECENRPCEVVTRLEVRFNSEFAYSGISR
ncbi:MAG: hypothetical protein DMG39_21060 [Acidobacteria bacterium]|nr:MAG: hypothetical protein DMG39_21060 [Acidobacteriota bacterium]